MHAVLAISVLAIVMTMPLLNYADGQRQS